LELRPIPHFLCKHYGEVVHCTEGNAIQHSLHRGKYDRSQNFTKRNAIDRFCLRGGVTHRGKYDRSQNFTKRNAIDRFCLRGGVTHREKYDRSKNFTKRNAIDRFCLRGGVSDRGKFDRSQIFTNKKAIDRNNLKRDTGFQREKRSIVNFTLTFYDRSFRPIFIFLRFLKICFYYKSFALFFSAHINFTNSK
jgi:hypothetical protein